MRLILTLSAICALSACGNSAPGDVANEAGPSEIKSAASITPDNADWGSFLPYYTDDTHALKPVLVGVAKIKAGEQIHPPHRHADEEYLMVTKGRGYWSLNGVESEAKAGDIMFARAWDYHGVRAAEDSPLEFVVFKYSALSGAAPTDPNPELPEEQTD